MTPTPLDTSTRPTASWWQHGAFRYLLPFLVAGGLLLGVRGCWLRQYVLRHDLPHLGLQNGDRCLVWLSSKAPQRGELIAFELHHNTYFDRCVALPGDTLWISVAQKTLHLKRLSPTDEALVLPRAAEPVLVTARNAGLFAKALCRYEDIRTDVSADGRLLLRGKEVTSIVFTHDLYWLEQQSPAEGFIARSAFIGKPWCITYSFSPQGEWRKSRTGRRLSSSPPYN